jgi:hypothetical protein
MVYSLPRNDTTPVDDVEPELPIVIIDYEIKYKDLVEQYEERIEELKHIIRDNPITYYEYLETVDNEIFVKYYPHKIDSLYNSVKLHNPAYGEDSEALGQFVDNYGNTDNISVMVNTVRNSTYNAIELNQTERFIEYENYTTYTKVGADSVLSVDDYNISYVQYKRGTEEGYYYDFGVGFFGNFEHEFELVVNDTEAGDGDSRNMGHPYALTNYIGDFTGAPALYDFFGLALRNIGGNDDKYAFVLLGVQNAGVLYAIVGTTWDVSDDILYCTMNRTNGNGYFWVYSDSNRTILVEQLNNTGGGLTDTYQYGYGYHAVDAGGDVNDWVSGSVANLWVGEMGGGYMSSGYIITTNYLLDPIAGGSVLVSMQNSTIPENTQITIQFSDDNETWVNNLGLDGYNTITDGFLSIDLRNLNYSIAYYEMKNLTTTDEDVTPRSYQSRLITTIGVGGTTNYFGWIFFMFIGTMLIIAVGISVYKR